MPGSPSSRPGSTSRCSGRWPAATSTTCPARASRSSSASTHDPNWWLKNLIERENIAVLPASLQLRKDDAELDARLDGLAREADVRREVEDFNERVIKARYSTPEGPPLVTMPRDVEETVAGWRERRTARTAVRSAGARASPRRGVAGGVDVGDRS